MQALVTNILRRHWECQEDRWTALQRGFYRDNTAFLASLDVKTAFIVTGDSLLDRSSRSPDGCFVNRNAGRSGVRVEVEGQRMGLWRRERQRVRAAGLWKAEDKWKTKGSGLRLAFLRGAVCASTLYTKTTLPVKTQGRTLDCPFNFLPLRFVAGWLSSVRRLAPGWAKSQVPQTQQDPLWLRWSRVTAPGMERSVKWSCARRSTPQQCVRRNAGALPGPSGLMRASEQSCWRQLL